MNTPSTITQYFQMKNNHDNQALLSLFTPDAIVKDTGEKLELQGTAEIKKWIEKSLSGLNLHTDIIDQAFNQEENQWIINTKVSGDFKASPALFKYFILLQDEKISSLRVEFFGSLK